MNHKTKRACEPQPPRRPRLALLCAMTCAALLLPATQVQAANYFFTGQVFQVNRDDADDTTITDADLTGDPRPYATVRLYDAETDVLLGEAVGDQDGIFTVHYNLPSGSTPDVRVRVVQELSDPAIDQELQPARDGINDFENVGPFAGSGVYVVADEFLSYGTTGLITDPGVGVVFTRVGKVEIPFIHQDSTAPLDPLTGLADFSGDTPDPISGLTRAQELHVHPFFEAPFSGGLLIFGAFGLPGGPCAGDKIRYYKTFISKWNGSSWGAPQVWDQTLRKIRTTVTVSPTVTVDHDLVPVGPFTGTLSGPATPVEDLYWVNTDSPGFPTSVFYSFPDQRVNWNTRNWNKAPDTGLADGIYRFTMDYYRYVSGSTDAPTVELLPDSGPGNCFTGTPASGSEGLHELVLRVDNHSLDVHFDHIFLKHSVTGNYLPQSGPTDVPDIASAFDFNAEGLCDILDLQGHYDVEVHFTAHHSGGFMRYYNLRATPNMGSTVSFTSASYPTGGTPPIWSGTPASGSVALAPGTDFARCGYIFALNAGSRLQDGYNYLQWRHPRLAFYVDP